MKKLLPLALLPLLLAACQKDAINKDMQSNDLTATDLVTMTDQMAHSITAAPDIAAIIAQRPMVIVLQPVQNQTNEIIPMNEKLLYVSRVRALLASKPLLRTQFVFVLNKADYDRLQAEEGAPKDLGSPVDRVQPEYTLTGTFYASTSVTKKQRGDTYLCDFQLQKISGNDTGQIIWEDKYETAKHMTKSLLD